MKLVRLFILQLAAFCHYTSKQELQLPNRPSTAVFSGKGFNLLFKTRTRLVKGEQDCEVGSDLDSWLSTEFKYKVQP